jgi:AraC family transcriptional regulator, regulatory protein of adaptative response / methylated-DNA-[protein]-cysteine methyltransferase
MSTLTRNVKVASPTKNEPNDYATANRSNRVRAKLGGSHCRFHEASNELWGFAPSEFRAGGTDMNIFFAIGECSLGSILVASSERGVCSLLIGDDPVLLAHDLQHHFPNANLVGDEREYEDLVAKVVGYIENPRGGLALPLDIRGTAFQQRVWMALQQIPVGATASYTDVATKIGKPKAVRAVAKACGANPLAVAIPCHRVVKNDGSLSGYRWGVERKRALLDREARA